MQSFPSVSSSSAIESYSKTSMGQTALVLKTELSKGLKEINKHIPENGRVCVDLLISSDNTSDVRISLAAAILITKTTQTNPDGTTRSKLNLKITMGAYEGGKFASEVDRAALTNPDVPSLLTTSEKGEEEQSANDHQQVYIQRYPLISDKMDLNHLGEEKNQPSIKIAQIFNQLFPKGIALPKDLDFIGSSVRVMVEAPSLEKSLFVLLESALRGPISHRNEKYDEKESIAMVIYGRADEGEFEKSVQAAHGKADPNWEDLEGSKLIATTTWNLISNVSNFLNPFRSNKSKITEID